MPDTARACVQPGAGPRLLRSELGGAAEAGAGLQLRQGHGSLGGRVHQPGPELRHGQRTSVCESELQGGGQGRCRAGVAVRDSEPAGRVGRLWADLGSAVQGGGWRPGALV